MAGGGAVKAYAFHLGVIRAMREGGFHFRGGTRWMPHRAPEGQREVNLYVGSSAGSCVVASMASGHSVTDLRRALRGQVPGVPTFGYRTLFVPVMPNPARHARRLARRLRLGALRPHHLVDAGGPFTTAGVERFFRRHVVPANRFADLGADLFITATQVNGSRHVIFGPVDSTGSAGYDQQRAYYDNVSVSRAVAAAVAVPPFFQPYTITNPASGEEIQYYDGEVRETLSAHIARDNGADFIITSSIWAPYQYSKGMGTVSDLGMSAAAEQALHQLVEEKERRDQLTERQHQDLIQHLAAEGPRLGLSEAATAELCQGAAQVLGHRPVPTLEVKPLPDDHRFFLEGFFRFNQRSLDRCMAAGERAFAAAMERQPGFARALDAALGA